MDVVTEKRAQNRSARALRRLTRGLRPGLYVLILLLGSACATTLSAPPAAPETGAFSLFLQPLPQEAHRLRFTISELVALRADGSDIPLLAGDAVFSAERLSGVQKRLVSGSLPPGRYLGLRLQIGSASLNGEEGEIALLSPPAMLIESPFTISKHAAEALFLSLSAERLVTDGAFFTPKFSLWKPERILTNLLGFASNSGSSSLTVFNKRNTQVIGALRVGKGAKDLVLDQRQGWLYLALADADSIAVIEITTREILGQVRLRAGDQPTELALSESGNRLLVLNRGSNSVSIIDTATLFELGRIKLNAQADEILMGPDENRAYVIHTASSSLSVLNLNPLSIQRVKTLANAPLKGAISADGQTLYLATEFSAELLVVDAVSLAEQGKIFIGSAARSLKLDRASGLLYVGQQNGGIAVVDPGALLAIDSFSLPEPIQFLTIDNEENALFALLPQSRRLMKLDLISKRPIGSLELEAASHAVVVMGER